MTSVCAVGHRPRAAAPGRAGWPADGCCCCCPSVSSTIVVTTQSSIAGARKMIHGNEVPDPRVSGPCESVVHGSSGSVAGMGTGTSTRREDMGYKIVHTSHTLRDQAGRPGYGEAGFGEHLRADYYPRSPIISITTSCWLQSHPNLQHESQPTIWLCFRPFSCSPDSLPQPKPLLKCYALCALVPKAVYNPQAYPVTPKIRTS